MSKKKVSIGANPRANKNVSADDWVTQGSAASEPTKKADDKQNYTRFTIDIPTDLHARIKSQCALKKVKMREEIITLLEKHF